MAEDQFIGDVVGGSQAHTAWTRFLRSPEFQTILSEYSWMWTTTPTSGTGAVPIGTIIAFGGTTAPDLWLVCDGSTLDTGAYPALAALIGHTYDPAGATCKLPDLRQRVLVGAGGVTGDSARPTARAIGQTGGEEAHTLSTGEMPSHGHSVNDPGHAHNVIVEDGSGNNYPDGGLRYQIPGSQGYLGFTTGAYTDISIGASGGGGSHNNMQPYAVINYIMRAR